MSSSSKYLLSWTILFGGALLIALTGSSSMAAQDRSFRAEGRNFLFDGKPYEIIAGEMHYTRIPRDDWRDRLRKARAMGLNTVTTYAFWNVHEPQPGVYDFSGQNDIAEYIREAGEEGLHVILRPGPYICAEWEFGGYPAWLLRDRNMQLRSDDPRFLAAMNQWFQRLGREVDPLLLQHGGPIIALQVENEYGSFGDDHRYMEAVKSALLKAGMNADVLYTADGVDNLTKGALPELPAVINFGAGDAKKSFAKLATLRPGGPRMSGEYWAGWFDHWGGRHFESSGKVEAAELAWMLKNGYSVNIYMFDGGTNFGWMNGANSDGTNYRPDTTSYDYDAPLDEQGKPRQKYFAFRDVIAKATHRALLPVPASRPASHFPIAPVEESASLWRNLPDPVQSAAPLTMEDLNQSYGYILYRTYLKSGDGGELNLAGLHDYAQVYVDESLVGTLDRRLATSRLLLPKVNKGATLDILVENGGRLNYTKLIQNERKGITGKVTLAGRELSGWLNYSLPMNDPTQLHFLAESCMGPCFFRTKMKVSTPADTYLDTRNLRKGEVWINQRPLGRFWYIGPQYTLYTPGAWLRGGQNEIVFFDLKAGPKERLTSIDHPLFGTTTSLRD